MTSTEESNMTKEPEQEFNKHLLSYKEINPTTIGIALIIPPVVSFFIVLFITSSFEMIAGQLWSLPIIWPEVLYLGGLTGGFLGGLISIWEISMFNKQKRKITVGKILSPDLYYIFALIGFTYILEFISESSVPQSILFVLEIGFFLIIGWNLSKILLEKETKSFNKHLPKTDMNKIEKNEMEKYKSEYDLQIKKNKQEN